MISLKKKLILVICITLLSIPSFCLAAAPVIKNPFNSLQVPIPGMQQFKEASEVTADGSFKSTWIAEYIVGIYRYGIGVIGIIAMMAVAFGGVMWVLSAGNPGKISEAKNWITGGITGLALGLGSYLILATINYNLVNYEPLGESYLKQEISDDSPPSTSGTLYLNTADELLKIVNLLKDHGIYCPVLDEDLKNASLDVRLSKIKQISQSFAPDIDPARATAINKMIYRYGSKNGRGSDPEGGPCPKTKVCYDCSGFASQVLVCAGLKKLAGSTGSIFSTGAQIVTDCQGDTLKYGGKFQTLRPGDVVGWAGDGHALIYTGNSDLDDSGAEDGRKTNSWGTRKLCDFYNRNHAIHILYIRPVGYDNQ